MEVSKAREEVGAKVPDWSHPLNVVSNLSFPPTPRTGLGQVWNRSGRSECASFSFCLTAMYASLEEVGGVTRAV